LAIIVGGGIDPDRVDLSLAHKPSGCFRMHTRKMECAYVLTQEAMG
jgi:hypothetical protein